MTSRKTSKGYGYPVQMKKEILAKAQEGRSRQLHFDPWGKKNDLIKPGINLQTYWKDTHEVTGNRAAGVYKGEYNLKVQFSFLLL